MPACKRTREDILEEKDNDFDKKRARTEEKHIVEETIMIENMAATCKRTREDILEEEDNDFDNKRARTEEKHTVEETIMIENEKIMLNTRLLKWNESLVLDEYSDCGLIVTRVKNFKDDSTNSVDEHVGLFTLDHLRRGRQDLLRSLIVWALKLHVDDFLDEETINILAEQVAISISSNFRFTKKTLTGMGLRRIVLLVEVDMVTIREYVIKDARQKDDHSVEQGSYDRLEQPFVNFDQFKGYSANVFTNETQGEEDEETVFVNFDSPEDNYVEPYTEDTGEEIDMLITREVVAAEDSEEDGVHEDGSIEEEYNNGTNQCFAESNAYEYGYDDDDDDDGPFQSLSFFQPSWISDTTLISDTEEIGGSELEEEEEIEEEISDTEEIGGNEEEEEEEIEDGSSEPEFMEIEDLLWRFFEDKREITRFDSHRSRDCRGLRQFKNASEISVKELYNKDNNEMDPCSLCLEGLAEVQGTAVTRTRCHHMFHGNCLISWLSRRDSCPLCRSRCTTLV